MSGIFFALSCFTNYIFPTFPKSLKDQSVLYIANNIDIFEKDMGLLPEELTREIRDILDIKKGHSIMEEAKTKEELIEGLTLLSKSFRMNKLKGGYTEEDCYADLELIKEIQDQYRYEVARIILRDDFGICTAAGGMERYDFVETHGFRANEFYRDFYRGTFAKIVSIHKGNIGILEACHPVFIHIGSMEL